MLPRLATPTSFRVMHCQTKRVSSAWSLAVFVTWTVTSFLCHYFAKVFLTLLHPYGMMSPDVLLWSIFNATVVTAFQIVLGDFLLAVGGEDGGRCYFLTTRLCHIAGTWLTNISMGCIFASSTLAIKMMEPITTAVAQCAMLGTPISPVSLISVPVIVGGTIAFIGNPSSLNNYFFGIAAALGSNIALAVRNVSLKSRTQTNETSQVVSLRRVSLPVTVSAAVSVLLWLVAYSLDFISWHVLYSVTSCLLAGVFHVFSSYLSTGIVPEKMPIVSHGVNHILKRALVVLLLYMTGSRVATRTNLFGLALCFLGLMVFARSRQRSPEKLIKTNVQSGNRPCLSTAIRTRLKNYILVAGLLMTGMGIGVLKDVALNHNTQRMKGAHSLPRSFTSDSSSLTRLANVDSLWEYTFSRRAYDIPNNESLLPTLDGYLSENASHILDFLHEDLHDNPVRSGFLSSQMRSTPEVITEAQRLHFDIMQRELSGFKYAMLLDIASFENKGDPCITVGEIYFLARIKIEVVYYCSASSCTTNNLEKAAEKAKLYTPMELVILVHGGGNVVGYAFSDFHRFKIFELFQGFRIFVFPQSVWIRDFRHPHLKRCATHYCCNENVTFIMRDTLSYSYAQKFFNGSTKFLMAPDMAFQIGPVKRVLSPVFDIIWIKRKDGETPGYKEFPDPPPGVRVHVSDWWKWLTPPAPSSLEKAHYICSNGFFYLQRGRVVITDRLHGHILATLMDIPHVLIDNRAHKLSAYHGSWTAGLENTIITDDPAQALPLALTLLHRYNDSLPPRVPFLHVDEWHGDDFSFEKVETSYV